MTIVMAEPATTPDFSSPPPHGVALYVHQAPVVDGKLDEKEWTKAPALDFPQALADATTKPPCTVRFLWTEEGVYVGFRTTDTTPVYGHIKPGDPIYPEDSFEVFIDQIGDHLQFYEIQADPAGQTFFKNYVLTAPPRLTAEKRFTPEFAQSELWRYEIPMPEGFEIASNLDPQTHIWSLEMFLPKSFVNRRRGGGQAMAPCTWRLNLVRHDWDLPKDAPGRKAKFMYWAPVLEGNPHNSPTAMGYLELKK